jgi:hypothetical protein
MGLSFPFMQVGSIASRNATATRLLYFCFLCLSLESLFLQGYFSAEGGPLQKEVWGLHCGKPEV